jgi:hypothetical protein
MDVAFINFWFENHCSNLFIKHTTPFEHFVIQIVIFICKFENVLYNSTQHILTILQQCSQSHIQTYQEPMQMQ